MILFVRRPLICTLLLMVSVVGCGSQQFSPASRELMKPLQTAVFSKKPEWIDAAEKKIQAQFDADNISRDELDALLAIVEKSRSGNWPAAQRTLTTMIDSQRATAFDVARLQEGHPNQVAMEHRKLAKQSRR